MPVLPALETRRTLDIRRAVIHATDVLASSRVAAVLLPIAIAIELTALLLDARHQLFWYDELITRRVSDLHPFSAVLSALQSCTDGMTPLYYALVQTARSIPGDPHITLRLPSLLGYILSLLGVYWFARKRLPAVAGLAAVLILTLTPFRNYAIEGRSYALIVGFLAIAAAFWQRVGEMRFASPFFCIFLALSVGSHHFAVMGILSFVVAEVVWTLLSRKLRWSVWISCAIAIMPFLYSLPVLLRFRSIFARNFWSRPTWADAIWTYDFYLNHSFALILFVLFALAIGYRALRIPAAQQETPLDRAAYLPDLALVAGFLGCPVVLVVLTKLANSGYTARYAWPAVLGISLGIAFVARRLWQQPSAAHVLAGLLVAFAFQASVDFYHAWTAGPIGTTERWSQMSDASRQYPGVPVVVASGMNYLEASEYAPEGLRPRLVEVADSELAVQFTGTDSIDATNLLLAQFSPMHVEDIASFEATTHKFLLQVGPRRDWLSHYLLQNNYRLQLLADGGENGRMYLVER